ncbi:MAG TPA: FlgD immunoglobulin-like domain containing protein [Candidatus Eisenbacteria bacterium]|nr:FlgD immunoglobulin-like domain containing protein [Candidatus Eisenbacteria bacterium]
MSSHSQGLLLALCLACPVPALAFDRTATPVPMAKDPSGPNNPAPVIDVCRCSGTVFELGPSGLTTREWVADITQSVEDPGPRDSCSVGSVLEVSWHSEKGPVVAWEYGLNPVDFSSPPPTFVTVGPNVRSATFDLGSIFGSQLVFTLRAIGPKATVEVTRIFVKINLPPDTWWSGPDPNSPALQLKPNGEKYVLLSSFTGLPGSLLSPDSAEVLPVLRVDRRTFFEVWEDTLFVRGEDDTVHKNSWVILHNGGFDPDSPYSVKVSDLAHEVMDVPDGPVLVPGPANGSPIGFRSVLEMSITPNGIPSRRALSGLYPIYDPNDVFNLPRIAGYWPIFQAGRVFAVAYAEDGNGDRDRRIPSGRELVLKIEAGTATPEEQALRSKVLTFEVDYPPYFVTGSPVFSPTPNQVFTSTQWGLNLVAGDADPWRPGDPPGGPSTNLTLRRRVKVIGKDLQGNDFVYEPPFPYVNQVSILTVPAQLAFGPCTLEVELCDCDACEDFPGTGRCITRQFPVIYQPPAGAASAASAEPAETRPLTPKSTLLLAPYPNPTSRSTSIRFTLAKDAAVELEVFDLAGSRVRRLASGHLEAGEHSRIWEGTNEAGQRVGQGIYFVRMRAAGVSMTRKLLLAP